MRTVLTVSWRSRTVSLGSQSQTYKCCLETRDGLGEDARETLEQELKVVELEEVRLVQEVEEMEKNQVRVVVALEAARQR